MARTKEGAALTVRHRRGQLAIRAQTLRDFRRIWPLWTGDEKTFRLLVSATIPLVRAHHSTSGAFARTYYEAFRLAEGVGGAATPRVASTVPAKRVETSLYVTGYEGVRKSIESGFSPQAARQNALVRVSGAVTRHVLSGGRESLLASTASDPVTEGWSRVTGGTPCAFCAVLATRGSAYSESSVDFQAHDHCVCSAEPTYAGSEMSADAKRLKEIYNQHASGTENPINEMRKALAAT